MSAHGDYFFLFGLQEEGVNLALLVVGLVALNGRLTHLAYQRFIARHYRSCDIH